MSTPRPTIAPGGRRLDAVERAVDGLGVADVAHDQLGARIHGRVGRGRGSTAGRRRAASTMCEPMKPAPPVTREHARQAKAAAVIGARPDAFSAP